ncbi:MAG TPA: sigma-70 family RNA polymerase sigma factor [Woeseiaceae bacterium]|jgi:RNA polymerase sigma-70 factor (ECF subfamily)|nr:sigma-70 family RNA polymerase sigma factor [Woeseiaceae bacterium]
MSTGEGVERKARFERLVSASYGELYRYAAWLSRDPGVAEVVVQESLLRAWKSLDALKNDNAAKAWLLTIVRRENARYFATSSPATLDIDDLSPAQDAMIAAVDDSGLEDLRRAILGLDEGYREPLVLQVLMGHSCREIADIMGINPGAVLTRLHRARMKLREALDGERRVAAARQADGV